MATKATKLNVAELKTERPIRLCSTITAGKWISALPLGTDGQSELVGSIRNIKELLTDILTSTNLMVLAGLGTSLSVKNADGKIIAPTMQDLWDKVHAIEGIEIEKVKTLVNCLPDDKNIETFLSKCKLALEFWPKEQDGIAEVKAFVAQAENIIKTECNFVNSTTVLPTHQQFLRKIARRSSRKQRAKIFTTNYDRCFEAAAALSRFVTVDGFSHSLPQYYDSSFFSYDIVRRDHSGEAPDYIESVFHLYKLHGSVDWTREAGEIVRQQDPENPILIYPRSSKYQQSFEPPYIDMMAAFQTAYLLIRQ